MFFNVSILKRCFTLKTLDVDTKSIYRIKKEWKEIRFSLISALSWSGDDEKSNFLSRPKYLPFRFPSSLSEYNYDQSWILRN